jgi:predicted glutamine amidotransferase
MCVIIVREPGVSIPEDKIVSACKVNPHGWGIVAVQNGKLSKFHQYKEGGNDPDMVLEALRHARDHKVLLHLRYVTAGDKDIKNCHPFMVLEEEKHGLDVAFAHNGTLYSYRDPVTDGFSDTAHFVQRFLRPLMERTILFSGKQDLLKDPFLEEMLKKECTASSVFTMMDGFGNVTYMNKQHGQEHDGWWASNSYSFKDDHREPVQTSTDKEWESWVKGYDAADFGYYGKPAHTAQQVVIEPDNDDDATQSELEDECEQIAKTLSMMPNVPSHALITELLTKDRKGFLQLTGITSLKEMTRFDPDDISEMVSYYPEATSLLIQDLLYELYLKAKPLPTGTVLASSFRPIHQVKNLPAVIPSVTTLAERADA